MDSAAGAPKRSAKGKSSGGTTAAVEAGEESDSESESSSSQREQLAPKDTAEELESFRLQWKAELTKKRVRNLSSNSNPVGKRNSTAEPGPSVPSEPFEEENSSSQQGEASLEEQATFWFLQGVGLERKGELYDAVRCYKKAIQLVPDIEYRVSSSGAVAPAVDSSDEEESLSNSDAENAGGEEDDLDDSPLTVRFLKIIEANGWNFFQKRREDDSVHINDLPVEVMSYIMRWLISSDLDVRSLDILSNACRGFYCVCRDEKLWEMACEKVWSDVHEADSNYSSFREMFLKRPRVKFDGCYICKVTYIRPGEHSFQDQSYRPWHFVEYYRYIRFLPNGEVLFLTTSDEPGTSVSSLRDAKYPRNAATMRGHYQLYANNIVSAIVKKPTANPPPSLRGRNKPQTQDVTTFHMEFEICPVRNKSNWMLKWSHYAVFITRCPINYSKKILNINQINNFPTITSTTFDLNPNKFPPLVFSRVKSYTQKSEGIL